MPDFEAAFYDLAMSHMLVTLRVHELGDDGFAVAASVNLHEIAERANITDDELISELKKRRKS